MEARSEAVSRSPFDGAPTWVLGGGVAALIAIVLVVLAVAGGDSLPERLGPPVEELAVERTQLAPNEIELTLRNTGPDEVTVSQAFVNDAYVDFQGGDEPIGRLGSDTIKLTYPCLLYTSPSPRDRS